MRWVITGGAGFIGSSLLRTLLAEDGPHRIVVLDSFAVGNAEEFWDGVAAPGLEREGDVLGRAQTGAEVRLARGDIRDREAVLRAAEGAEVMVHLAANTGVAPSVADPRMDCEVNVLGTLNVLEAARAHGCRVVFASSGAPAGIVEPPITEQVVPRPASPYGASKLAGEGYCSAYAQAFGVAATALRFSNVYGPGSGRKGSAVATFIRRAMAGEPITVNGDGTQTRDFVYVDDLVRAVRLAASSEAAAGEVFQIGTGVETSVNGLLDLLRPALAEAGIPFPALEAAPRSPADVPRNYVDPAKARRVLGWEARMPLAQGLRHTAAWFAGRARGAAA